MAGGNPTMTSPGNSDPFHEIEMRTDDDPTPAERISLAKFELDRRAHTQAGAPEHNPAETIMFGVLSHTGERVEVTFEQEAPEHAFPQPNLMCVYPDSDEFESFVFTPEVPLDEQAGHMPRRGGAPAKGAEVAQQMAVYFEELLGLASKQNVMYTVLVEP